MKILANLNYLPKSSFIMYYDPDSKIPPALLTHSFSYLFFVIAFLRMMLSKNSCTKPETVLLFDAA